MRSIGLSKRIVVDGQWYEDNGMRTMNPEGKLLQNVVKRSLFWQQSLNKVKLKGCSFLSAIREAIL